MEKKREEYSDQINRSEWLLFMCAYDIESFQFCDIIFKKAAVDGVRLDKISVVSVKCQVWAFFFFFFFFFLNIQGLNLQAQAEKC